MNDFIDAVASSRERSEIEEGLDEFQGIEYNSVVFAGKVKDNDVDFILNFGVSDVDKFYKFLSDKDSDFSKKEFDGYVSLQTDKGAIIVDDKEAYIVFKDSDILKGAKAINEIEKWMEEAKEKPLADWKREYLDQESFVSGWLNLAWIKDISPRGWKEFESIADKLPGLSVNNLSIGYRLNIHDKAATTNVTVFQGDKVMKCPFGGKFDASLLKYAGKNDVLVIGASVNNTTVNLARLFINKHFDEQIEYLQDDIKYYNDRYSSNRLNETLAAKQLFNRIADSFDGSVMFSAGVNSGVSLEELSHMNDFNATHLVLAAKMKPGKANEVVKTLMDEAFNKGYYSLINTIDNNNWSIGTEDVTIKIMIDGDNLVCYTGDSSTSGGNFDKAFFENTWFAYELKADAGMDLLKKYKLPCGYDAKIRAEEMSFDAEASFPGSEFGFVQTLSSILQGILHEIK